MASTELMFTSTPSLVYFAKVSDQAAEEPFFLVARQGELEGRLATWISRGLKIDGIRQIDGSEADRVSAMIEFMLEADKRREEFGFDEWDEDRMSEDGAEIRQIGHRIFAE